MDLINTYIFLATKFIFLLGTFIYLIFALVIVKQTTTLSKSIYDKFNLALIIFSYVHLIFSLFLILLAFVIL